MALHFSQPIVWQNVFALGALHIAAIWAAFSTIFQAKGSTILIASIYALFTGYGITIGAHRLWSHRSFKAHWSVRLVLLWLQTAACQNCLWVWVRDHRLHHMKSDTNADPHNINRGFFFSHVGWLMMKKHPDVVNSYVSTMDLDLDPMINVQKAYYYPLAAIAAIIVPTWVCVYFGDTYLNGLMIAVILRIVIVLNITWSVNSFAHMYGDRPYNPNIKATQNPIVALLTSGEGWHNYHHMYPFDYRTSELGSRFNMSKRIIDLLAHFKLVTHRKIKSRMTLDINLAKKAAVNGDITDYSNSKQDKPFFQSKV